MEDQVKVEDHKLLDLHCSQQMNGSTKLSAFTQTQPGAFKKVGPPDWRVDGATCATFGIPEPDLWSKFLRLM